MLSFLCRSETFGGLAVSFASAEKTSVRGFSGVSLHESPLMIEFLLHESPADSASLQCEEFSPVAFLAF